MNSKYGFIDRSGKLLVQPQFDEAGDFVDGVARVVRDLKAVSRVDPEERRPIDLRAEVETALKLAQNELRHRATVVEALGAVPGVAAAEFQLGQVFLNLLLNAAYVTPDGGEVRVRGAAPEGAVEVAVEDSGPGVDPATRRRLFEPLVTTKEKGIGLGLALVKRIAERHGGSVEYSDRPGGGARFTVRVPR